MTIFQCTYILCRIQDLKIETDGLKYKFGEKFQIYLSQTCDVKRLTFFYAHKYLNVFIFGANGSSTTYKCINKVYIARYERIMRITTNTIIFIFFHNTVWYPYTDLMMNSIPSNRPVINPVLYYHTAVCNLIL